MHFFTPHTEDDIKRMSAVADPEKLFSGIPDSVRLKRPLDLPAGLCELDVAAYFENKAAKNTVYGSVFRGAGAYCHFIPAVVTQLASREEFVTAYTPYQPEISQGILQGIFEYQSMMCMLTGMDISNASVYDGATAAAEAVYMCMERGRERVLASSLINPRVLQVISTYLSGRGIELELLPEKDGLTDSEAAKKTADEKTACLITQQPNYYGNIEDISAFSDIAHECGARSVVSQYPISMALLKTPAECGADIAVAEGQPLGLPLSFGGPYLGIMTCKAALARKLPGRIVGETKDADGKRAYVLTLQTREQHIRRERASSSICSNEALCALTSAIYLSAMSSKGLKETAELCAANAHYAAKRICSIKGWEMKYNAEFFNEFVTTCPTDAHELNKALSARGILGGLPLSDGSILWCATECTGKAKIDALCEAIEQEAR